MALSIDTYASTSSNTFNYTVGSGANVLLVFPGSYASSVAQNFVNSVTYGGQPLTRLASISANAAGTSARGIEAWVLVNPPTGSNTVAVALGNGTYQGMIVLSLSGVDVSGGPNSFGAIASSGASGTASASFTTAGSSGLLISAIITRGGTATPQGDVTPLTYLNGYSSVGSWLAEQNAAPGTQKTTVFSIPGSDNWAMVDVFVPAPTAAPQGGSSGGGGLGNMLGGFFMGDTTLGGDPGSGSGSGSGSGGLGNMLGGYMLGEPILGGDPGSGSGGGGTPPGGGGNTWQLVGIIQDGTVVTGDLTRITQYIQAQQSKGKTVVAGRLGLVPEQLVASTVNGRTSVKGGLYSPVPLAASIATRTTITGQLTRSILRGQIHGQASGSATLSMSNLGLHAQTVHDFNTIVARLSLAPEQIIGSTISSHTTVTANLIKPFQEHADPIHGATAITGELTRHLLRAQIQGTTSVSAALNLKGHFYGQIRGKTAVVSQAVLRIQVTGSAWGASSVTGRMHSYPTDFQDVAIHGGTAVANPVLGLLHIIPPTTGPALIQGNTAVTGAVIGQWTLLGSLDGGTKITGDVTFPRWFSNGEIIAGSTVVTADAFKSTLHGGFVHAGTSLSSSLRLYMKLGAQTIKGNTKVTVAFARQFQLAGSSAGATSVKARLHVYPMDFYDVQINTGATVTGALTMLSVIKKGGAANIAGSTALTATAIVKMHLLANQIKGHATVSANLRYAFGNDIIGRATVRGRLGLLWGDFKGSTIRGKTTITAQTPENFFTGLAAGKTSTTASVTVGYAVVGSVLAGTTFHSHFPGRNAYDGPVGSVNLTAVPRGDLGIPSEIDCSTTPTADITIERRRLLVVFGNVGLAVEKSMTTHGTVIAGTETRYVGEPLEAPVPVSAYNALYV